MSNFNSIDLFNAYLRALRNKVLWLSADHGIFLRKDEAGNIWISEDGIECYKVRGWHTAMNEVEKIIKRKELRDIENAK